MDNVEWCADVLALAGVGRREPEGQIMVMLVQHGGPSPLSRALQGLSNLG